MMRTMLFSSVAVLCLMGAVVAPLSAEEKPNAFGLPNMEDIKIPTEDEIKAMEVEISEEELAAEMARVEAEVAAMSEEEKATTRQAYEAMMQHMSEEEQQILRENHPLFRE